MVGRVWQKDKNKLQRSKKAQKAWWVQIPDCNGEIITKKIGDQKIADKVLTKLNEFRDRGKLKKIMFTMRMDGLFDEYLKKKDLSEETKRTYKYHLKALKRDFGQCKLNEMTSDIFKIKRKNWTS